MARRHSSFLRNSAVAGVLVLVLATPVFAFAEIEPGKEPGEQPGKSIDLRPVSIQYGSSELITKGPEKKLILKGAVMATQGDLSIRAERVEASFQSSPGAIRRITADGGVTVTSGETIGRAERAEFDNEARTVTLSGGPTVLDQGAILRAETIILHIDESRIECTRCSVEVDPARVNLDGPLRTLEKVREKR